MSAARSAARKTEWNPPRFEVADILERNKGMLRETVANTWQLRTLHAVRKCRTAALGGHIDKCNNNACNHVHISYNSCRNRHCPKCQGHKREEWIRARESELLDVPYFHVVFTLPHELNGLCLHRPKTVYGNLFRTAWSVIQAFAANHDFLGGKTGMVAILHTWGQDMSLHPHLHCIIPGGGITHSGKWKYTKSDGKFLFPVKAMAKVFRAKFVAGLREQLDLPQHLYDGLFQKKWVVYCKRPFFRPEQVIEYLGRYTHKIAISNHRIKGIDNGKVTFSAKDYRKGGKKYLLTLADKEFIRRFAMHVLPKGFVRIRHYGILSSYHKRLVLPKLKKELIYRSRPAKDAPLLHRLCPVCKKGKLLTIATFDKRGPPDALLNRWKPTF